MKKKFIILLITLVLIATFSGCIGEKEATPEEKKYWNHMLKSDSFIEKRTELWEEARKANNQEDYDKAEQLFRQMVEYNKLAIEETQAAIDVAPNPKLKEFAEHMKTSTEYGMQSDQKLVKMVQHSKRGDEASAEASLKEAQDYAKKSMEMLEKAKALEREGLR